MKTLTILFFMLYGSATMAFNIHSNMMWENNCEYQSMDMNIDPTSDVDVNLMYSDNKEYQQIHAINEACDHDGFKFKTGFGFNTK